MELVRLEHKKIWRRSSVKISVLLCFIYIVVFGTALSFQWFSFGSSDDHTSSFGNNFDGYSMIKESQKYSYRFGGALTDESLQQIVRNYQEKKAAGLDREADQTDWQTINSYLGMLYPELKEEELYQTMISYVNPEELTDFYGRREQAIEDFLEVSGQDGAEREYLLQMEARTEKPFSYEFVEGWSCLLGSMAADLGTVMALFLAIVLSSVFSGEWHENTTALLLTTKNGWGSIARAKIIAGLLFTVEFFLLLTLGMLLLQSFFLGWTGWDMPIQTIKLIAIAPLNMLQAELYEYGFAFFGAIGFAGVVLMISAAAKNNVLSLLLGLTAVYGPMMIVKYLPYNLQKALDLLPLVGSSTDIFRTNTFRIFGVYIWSPYLLITVPVLIGILCMPIAVSRWSRRIKK